MNNGYDIQIMNKTRRLIVDTCARYRNATMKSITHVDVLYAELVMLLDGLKTYTFDYVIRNNLFNQSGLHALKYDIEYIRNIIAHCEPNHSLTERQRTSLYLHVMTLTIHLWDQYSEQKQAQYTPARWIHAKSNNPAPQQRYAAADIIQYFEHHGFTDAHRNQLLTTIINDHDRRDRYVVNSTPYHHTIYNAAVHDLCMRMVIEGDQIDASVAAMKLRSMNSNDHFVHQHVILKLLSDGYEFFSHLKEYGIDSDIKIAQEIYGQSRNNNQNRYWNHILNLNLARGEIRHLVLREKNNPNVRMFSKANQAIAIADSHAFLSNPFVANTIGEMNILKKGILNTVGSTRVSYFTLIKTSVSNIANSIRDNAKQSFERHQPLPLTIAYDFMEIRSLMESFLTARFGKSTPIVNTYRNVSEKVFVVFQNHYHSDVLLETLDMHLDHIIQFHFDFLDRCHTAQENSIHNKLLATHATLPLMPNLAIADKFTLLNDILMRIEQLNAIDTQNKDGLHTAVVLMLQLRVLILDNRTQLNNDPVIENYLNVTALLIDNIRFIRSADDITRSRDAVSQLVAPLVAQLPSKPYISEVTQASDLIEVYTENDTLSATDDETNSFVTANTTFNSPAVSLGSASNVNASEQNNRDTPSDEDFVREGDNVDFDEDEDVFYTPSCVARTLLMSGAFEPNVTHQEIKTKLINIF